MTTKANRVVFISPEFEAHLYSADSKHIIGKVIFEGDAIRVVKYKGDSNEVERSSGPLSHEAFIAAVL